MSNSDDYKDADLEMNVQIVQGINVRNGVKLGIGLAVGKVIADATLAFLNPAFQRANEALKPKVAEATEQAKARVQEAVNDD